MEVVARYLGLLVLTLVVEVPLAAALAGSERRGEVTRACLALNLLTHPVATGLAWLAGADWLALELGVLAVEALGYQAVARLGGESLQINTSLRLRFDHDDCVDRRVDRSRCQCRAVDQGTAAVDQEVDHRLGRGDKTALTTDRLAQRSDTNRYAVLDVQGFADAASPLAQNTGAVRFIDDHVRVE